MKILVSIWNAYNLVNFLEVEINVINNEERFKIHFGALSSDSVNIFSVKIKVHITTETIGTNDHVVKYVNINTMLSILKQEEITRYGTESKCFHVKYFASSLPVVPKLFSQITISVWLKTQIKIKILNPILQNYHNPLFILTLQTTSSCISVDILVNYGNNDILYC